jgi:hypothetical protein
LSEKLADSTPPERIEFLPSTLRRLAIWCLWYIGGALVGFVISGGPLIIRSFRAAVDYLEFVGLVGAILIGAVFLLSLIVGPLRGRLLIYNDKVRGRASWSLREVEFPISLLDQRSSCHRRPHQRLLGYQVLHSINGEEICWERAAFEKASVAQVLDRLRCD